MYTVENGTHVKSVKVTNICHRYYSVSHISIHPSKELCSKMAPGEVGVSLP